MQRGTTRRIRIGALGATAALCGTIAIAGAAQAAVATDTSDLREAVTVGGVKEHLAEFQDIADENGGNRQAGTSGHEESVDYVQGLLAAAGYDTWTQEFDYVRAEYVDSTFELLSDPVVPYAYLVDYYDMTGSGTGAVTAPVTGVDLHLDGDRASTSGCEAEDFVGFPAGDIALLQRGTCDFSVKADNAIAAGATAVIIFNQGNTPEREVLYGGTLGEEIRSVPVVSATFAMGEELAAATAEFHLDLDLDIVDVTTRNLFADSTGRTDRTVVVGGHLDSVGEGPGINDNGSGTAAILETALQMAELGIEPENRVRFAFWSGEEDGLLGSYAYTDALTRSEVKDHAANLNFDMVGSPNAVNFVYDGDGDAFGLTGPNGSALIESVFTDFFASQGASTEATAFDGRSDYAGFIESGIPAGGLFSGAEGVKTPEQAAIYGGVAGVSYDPCYHQACDTYDNIDDETLGLMSDAIAHATLTFADTTSAVNGTAKGKGHGKVGDLEFAGSSAKR